MNNEQSRHTDYIRHQTRNEDKEKQANTTLKTKKHEQNGLHQQEQKGKKKLKKPGRTHVRANGKQFIFLIRHPSCYSYLYSQVR